MSGTNACIVSTKKADVMLLSGGIVLVKLIPECVLEVRDIKKIVTIIQRITQGKLYTVILDGNMTKKVSDKAITFASLIFRKNCMALAIVIRYCTGFLYADYFIKFSNPMRPVKMFSTCEKAAQWLMKNF
jgi:hypothetical protein